MHSGLSLVFRTGLAAALMTAGTASAANPRIVNGLPTHEFPTTGALLHNSSGMITPSTAGAWCSGTLIGCNTFLTAAHCVDDSMAANRYWVYLQHGGIYEVSSITSHPDYEGDGGRDVAIIKLDREVEGIDPTTFNSTHDLDSLGVGLDGVIAGFGQTSGSGNDYAIKRYGDIVTADCDTVETEGEANDKLVCWDFANPLGAPGDDSNTCNGDSGGPLFMDFSGVTEVVGVTSAGSAVDCLPHDHSWDASVYYNRVFIGDELGADQTSTCGGLPPVGDGDVTVTANSGTLSSGNASDSYVVTLAGSPNLVRFTFNGEDTGTFKANFHVKAGAGGAGPGDFDCKADGGVIVGACEFAAPTPGDWSITLQRSSGTGDYQITTTEFDGPPPVCGNGSAEAGEECDGVDLGICPIGPCAVDCSCPAPVCGNDVTESGEQCDDDDDSACPGLCLGNCTCDEPLCSDSDLFGLSIRSDADRFQYKAELQDPDDDYALLDPREGIALSITDGSGTASMAIPADDPGWSKSRPSAGKYKWKGDGSIDGLTRIKFQRKTGFDSDYWRVQFKGREVPGGGTIDVSETLDFTLTVDGTCHQETW